MTEATTPPHRSGPSRSALVLVAAALVLASLGAFVRDTQGPGRPLPKDFAQYYVAGKLALRGRLQALYFADLHAGLTQAQFPTSEFARTGREFGIAETSYFLYPPWVAWAYAPLALLPPWPAFALASLLAWLALLAGFALLARAAPTCGAAAAIAAFALLFASPPVRAALATAQASVPLFLLLALFAHALSRGREREAGAWWGVMAALKLFPLVFVLWLVARGRWQAVVSGALAMAALFALGAVAGGVATTARFFSLLAQHLPYSTAYAPNQSLTALGLRLATGANPFGWEIVAVPAGVAWAVRAALLGGLFATLVLVGRQRDGIAWGWSDALGLALFTTWALFVAPDAWLHHLVALALPFTIAGARWLAGARPRAGWIALWLLAGALLYGYDAYQRIAAPGPGSLLRTALASAPLVGGLVLWTLLALQVKTVTTPTGPAEA